MKTFKKCLKTNKTNKAQAIVEYFILFVVIALLTIYIMKPNNPLSIPGIKTQLEGAFDKSLDKMGVK